MKGIYRNGHVSSRDKRLRSMEPSAGHSGPVSSLPRWTISSSARRDGCSWRSVVARLVGLGSHAAVRRRGRTFFDGLLPDGPWFCYYARAVTGNESGPLSPGEFGRPLHEFLRVSLELAPVEETEVARRLREHLG